MFYVLSNSVHRHTYMAIVCIISLNHNSLISNRQLRSSCLSVEQFLQAFREFFMRIRFPPGFRHVVKGSVNPHTVKFVTSKSIHVTGHHRRLGVTLSWNIIKVISTRLGRGRRGQRVLWWRYHSYCMEKQKLETRVGMIETFREDQA